MIEPLEQAHVSASRQRTAVVVRRAALAMSFTSLPAAVGVFFTGAIPIAIGLTVYVAFLQVPLAILRRGGNPQTAAHFVLAALTAVILTAAVSSGGARGLALWSLMIPVAAATLVLPWRQAVIWAAVSLLSGAAFGVLDLVGVRLPMTIRDDAFGATFMVGYLSIQGIVLVILRAYEQARSERERQIAEHLDRVGVMLTELDALDHALRSASDRLGDPRSKGLAHDMSQRARVGADTSRQARSSVAELIEDSHHVGGLVDALQSQSTHIQTVLENADRVGRRLHMLSLNAELEASKTGEAAFGLVANEIRRVTELVTHDMTEVRTAAGQVQASIDELGAATASLLEQSASTSASAAASLEAFVALHQAVDTVAATANDLRGSVNQHVHALQDLMRLATSLGQAVDEDKKPRDATG